MLPNETEQLSQTNKPRRRGLGYYWPFGLAAGIYALDQFTKWLTENNLGPYGSGKEVEILGGLVRFRYVRNTGASFSMLQGQPWIFTVVASAVSIGILVWYVWQGTHDRWYQLCVGMIFAGAVGNLSDRFFKEGAVTDMINIPWLEFFKNFNVADMSLNFGVAILVLVTLVRVFLESRKHPAESEGKASE